MIESSDGRTAAPGRGALGVSDLVAAGVGSNATWSSSRPRGSPTLSRNGCEIPSAHLGVPSSGDEDLFPLVRGAHVGRTYSRPFRIEPERGKVGEDSIKSPNNECCHVLNEHVSGS